MAAELAPPPRYSKPARGHWERGPPPPTLPGSAPYCGEETRTWSLKKKKVYFKMFLCVCMCVCVRAFVLTFY